MGELESWVRERTENFNNALENFANNKTLQNDVDAYFKVAEPLVAQSGSALEYVTGPLRYDPQYTKKFATLAELALTHTAARSFNCYDTLYYVSDLVSQDVKAYKKLCLLANQETYGNAIRFIKGPLQEEQQYVIDYQEVILDAIDKSISRGTNNEQVLDHVRGPLTQNPENIGLYKEILFKAFDHFEGFEISGAFATISGPLKEDVATYKEVTLAALKKLQENYKNAVLEGDDDDVEIYIPGQIEDILEAIDGPLKKDKAAYQEVKQAAKLPSKKSILKDAESNTENPKNTVDTSSAVTLPKDAKAHHGARLY